jgi:predicted  nucleic acid-binding Zn-ribbon protein
METVVIPALVVSTVIALVGYLLKRAIDGVDRNLSSLVGKVDGLSAKDSAHSEAIVELRVRMAHMETEHRALQSHIQRRRSTDADPEPA